MLNLCVDPLKDNTKGLVICMAIKYCFSFVYYSFINVWNSLFKNRWIICFLMAFWLVYICANFNFNLSHLSTLNIKILKDSISNNLDEKCPPANEMYPILVEQNSHPLPDITWSYNKTNGICQGEDSKNCLPSFLRLNEGPEFFFAKPHKTVHCIVKKSMSRVFKSLSCLLNNPAKFSYRRQDIISNAMGYGCYKNHSDNFESRFRSVDEGLKKYTISADNGWQYAMIVRDPIERFLSAYMYVCLVRCECIGCGANLTCFVEKEFKSLWNMTKTRSRIDSMTVHLHPQTWNCELNQYKENFKFLKYSSNSTKFFDEELGPFLKSRNVSEDALDYIRERITSERTQHSTTGFEYKEFLENRLRHPYLLKMLVQMYYLDYKFFNFTLPKIPE